MSDEDVIMRDKESEENDDEVQALPLMFDLFGSMPSAKPVAPPPPPLPSSKVAVTTKKPRAPAKPRTPLGLTAVPATAAPAPTNVQGAPVRPLLSLGPASPAGKSLLSLAPPPAKRLACPSDSLPLMKGTPPAAFPSQSPRPYPTAQSLLAQFGAVVSETTPSEDPSEQQSFHKSQTGMAGRISSQDPAVLSTSSVVVDTTASSVKSTVISSESTSYQSVSEASAKQEARVPDIPLPPPAAITPEPDEYTPQYQEIDAKLAEITVSKQSLMQTLKALGGTLPGAPSRKTKSPGNENLTKTLDGAGAHWDYLIQEMSWMSNDFRVERKWKVQSAKKLVREAERVITKKEVDKKRENVTRVSGLRKQAMRAAREVKKSFWDKIDRIVLFKNNAEYITEQQQAMDRNLDRLLVQTERYTSSLIRTAAELSRKRKLALRESEEEARREVMELEQQSLVSLMHRYSGDAPVEAGNKRTRRAPVRSTAENGESAKQEEASSILERFERGSTGEMTLQPNHPAAKVDATNDGSDESWRDSGSNAGEDEEVTGAEDNDPQDDGNGIKLAADMDLPIEELLEREYGVTRAGSEPSVVSSVKQKKTPRAPISSTSTMATLSAAEAREKRAQQRQAKAAPAVSAAGAATEVSMLQSDKTMEVAAEAGEEQDDESWGNRSEDEDDDEEEEIEQADLENPDDDGNEDALAADMDMPLEELLAKTYGVSLSKLNEEEVLPAEIAAADDVKEAKASEDDDESWHEDDEQVLEDDDDPELDVKDENDDGNEDGLLDDMNIPIEELLARRYGITPGTPSQPSRAVSEVSDSNLKDLLEEVADGDDDQSFSEPSGEEDDEETFAQAELEVKDDAKMDELAAEAEIPLEELLKAQYPGFGAGGNEEEMDVPSEEEESKKKKKKQQHVTIVNMTENKSNPSLMEEEEGDEKEAEVPLPFLLSKDRPLRAYQREGLNWLVSLHDRQLNGILADEMGLGKTAQTIALLAHLAGNCNIWGPHLVVVPTSVILNWDLEFKAWCPGLKVLTYFGSTAERTAKRAGWTKPNAFHVCVTSYQLAVQDANVFRRKKWYYIICDEAHALKNSKSQRWQTLLSFQAKRRLLITGTPLQNSLMELWSLMHFLMPEVFRSQSEFKHWFSNPLQAMVEEGDKKNAGAVKRLHAVMRPFILRRLKRDVAKQLPSKFEHIVRLPLARRQRFLYEDFISLSSTQATLQSGAYIGMMSVLMKLRMVCNHPDLFEPRLVTSSFCVDELITSFPRCVLDIFSSAVASFPLETFLADREFASPDEQERQENFVPSRSILQPRIPSFRAISLMPDSGEFANIMIEQARTESIPKQWRIEDDLGSCMPAAVKAKVSLLYSKSVLMFMDEKRESAVLTARRNQRRIEHSFPVFGDELISTVRMTGRRQGDHVPSSLFLYEDSLEKRLEDLGPVLNRFVFVTPIAQGRVRLPSNPNERANATRHEMLEVSVTKNTLTRKDEALLHPVAIRQRISFPDRYLIQYDCGKLQTLAVMLQRLKRGNHRVLIFTQMSRMLDILERFLNLHSHTYFRLDGATKVEERQSMMDRFNRDARIFCFILSTRSGGLGINLTGADTVIFYDSDWNPSMDAQAQDRAHRIGQTRDVHIYRLVSEQTVEENILLKSNQKRHLNRLSVEEGKFSSLLGMMNNPEELKANEDILAQVEDESDRLAAKRAKEEELEMLNEEGGNDEAPVPSATSQGTTGQDKGDDDDQVGGDEKIEDEQGNVLMTKSQFQELESNLKPIDQYAMDFRTKHFIVIDRLKEGRRQKEQLKAQMIEEQTKDWEIETLEHNKKIAEQEAEEDLVADKDSRLPETQAEALFHSSQRCFKLELKLLKMTGRAWKQTLERGPGERRKFYLNEDTKETSWERPRILDAEEDRRKMRRGGWGAVTVSILSRIARFIRPAERFLHFNRVCTQWYLAVDGNASMCTFVESQPFQIGRDDEEDATREFLFVGSHVQARHLGSDSFYAGTIVGTNGSDGTFDILFTDGEMQRQVLRAHVRKDKGARVTLVRHAQKDGSHGAMFEVLNDTLASEFACGTPLQDPLRVNVLALNDSENTFVLRAGEHHLPAETGLTMCAPGKRIVGEAFWSREKRRFEIANERILPDDDKMATPPTLVDGDSVDVLQLNQIASVVAACNQTVEISGGSVSGVYFACPVKVKGRGLSATSFVECFFAKGVDIIFCEEGSVVFDACRFEGNNEGPGLRIGKQVKSLRCTRCKFAKNLVALEFVCANGQVYDDCIVDQCSFKGNTQGAVRCAEIAASASATVSSPRDVVGVIDVMTDLVNVVVANLEEEKDIQPEIATGNNDAMDVVVATVDPAASVDIAAPPIVATADAVLPASNSGTADGRSSAPTGGGTPRRVPNKTMYAKWKEQNLVNLSDATSKYVQPRFTCLPLLLKGKKANGPGGVLSRSPATAGGQAVKRKKKTQPAEGDSGATNGPGDKQTKKKKKRSLPTSDAAALAATAETVTLTPAVTTAPLKIKRARKSPSAKTNQAPASSTLTSSTVSS